MANTTGATNLKIVGNVYLYSSSVSEGSILTLDKNNRIVGLKVDVPLPEVNCVDKVALPWRYPVSIEEPVPSKKTITKYPFEGKVGIGTCSPSAKLHLHNIDKLPNSFIVSSETNNHPFVIKNNGYVGIGTYNPAGDLHISSDSATFILGVNKDFEIKSFPSHNIINSFDPLFINLDGNSSNLIWIGNIGHPVYFEVLGKVGINSVPPQADLHIGGTNPALMIGNNNYLKLTPNSILTNGQDLYVYNAISPNANSLNMHLRGELRTYSIQSVANNPLTINTNINNSVIIGNPNGNNNIYIHKRVGIGCNIIPWSFTLAVKGKIICEEVLVDSLFGCDYVFEPTYKLMPWPKVETYYKTHKHLPGVPPAKEMQEKGVQLGEMNMILLRKIEELHLYIEELHDKIEELNKRIETLENQLNEQK